MIDPCREWVEIFRPNYIVQTGIFAYTKVKKRKRK